MNSRPSTYTGSPDNVITQLGRCLAGTSSSSIALILRQHYNSEDRHWPSTEPVVKSYMESHQMDDVRGALLNLSSRDDIPTVSSTRNSRGIDNKSCRRVRRDVTVALRYAYRSESAVLWHIKHRELRHDYNNTHAQLSLYYLSAQNVTVTLQTWKPDANREILIACVLGHVPASRCNCDILERKECSRV